MRVSPMFKEVLWDLQAPDLFAVSLTAEEEDRIFEQIVKDSKTNAWPQNFLEWRDAAYDAMVELGYEIAC